MEGKWNCYRQSFGHKLWAARKLTKIMGDLLRKRQALVSAKRTPSCKDSRRNAMLRHDQALKEGVDEVAKAGFRART